MHRDGCGALPLPREVVCGEGRRALDNTVIKLEKALDCFGVENSARHSQNLRTY